MSKQNKKIQVNIVAFLIILVVLIFVLFKFVFPAFGIEVPSLKGRDENDIEYSHVEGFPRDIAVSELFEKRRLVITNADELKAKIAEIDKNGEIKVPEINFDKKIALFVSASTREGGGFETRIKKIRKDDDELNVEIRDTEPGETCMNTQVQTVPMDLVIIDKTDLRIEFKVVKYVKECD